MTELSKWAELDADRMLDEIEAAHGSAIFDAYSHLDPTRAARQMSDELGIVVTPYMLLDQRTLALAVEDAINADEEPDEQSLMASLVGPSDSFGATLVARASSYVQGKLHGNGNNPGTTVAVTLDAAALSGSALLVSVGFADAAGTVSSITDDKGNSYTILDTAHDVGIGYTWVTAVGFVSNAPSTVTATLSGTFNFSTIMVDEVSNVTAVRDHASRMEVFSSDVTSGNVSAVVGDFVYSSCVDVNSNGLAVGSGFTQAQYTGSTFMSEYKTAGGTTVAGTYTQANTNDVCAAAVVVLH